MAKRNLKIVPHVPAPMIYTREARADQRLEYIVDELGRVRKNSTEEIEKFSVKLLDRPASAFEWSQSAFQAAARVEVSMKILAWVGSVSEHLADEYSPKASAESIMKKIYEILSRDVMQKARWPEHSTSTQSNEMSLCINAEMAEWMEKFGRAIERLEDL